MCGRYANHLTELGIWRELLHDWPEGVATGYNVAPTQMIPVFYTPEGVGMRWGLVPHWSKEPTSKYSTFNARIEGIDKKPAFRDAWRDNRRCLIPALGYYEWRSENGSNQPYFIQRKDSEPMVFGGIWDAWNDGALLSCAIVTREAEGTVSSLHPRMPLMIEPADAQIWLGAPPSAVTELTKMKPSTALQIIKVRRAVNNPQNQGAELIEPAELERYIFASLD